MSNTELLDEICSQVTSTETLNALHACRDGHPLGRDNPRKWSNALFLTSQQPSYIVSSEKREWLRKQADAEEAS